MNHFLDDFSIQEKNKEAFFSLCNERIKRTTTKKIKLFELPFLFFEGEREDAFLYTPYRNGVKGKSIALKKASIPPSKRRDIEELQSNSVIALEHKEDGAPNILYFGNEVKNDLLRVFGLNCAFMAKNENLEERVRCISKEKEQRVETKTQFDLVCRYSVNTVKVINISKQSFCFDFEAWVNMVSKVPAPFIFLEGVISNKEDYVLYKGPLQAGDWIEYYKFFYSDTAFCSIGVERGFYHEKEKVFFPMYRVTHEKRGTSSKEEIEEKILGVLMSSILDFIPQTKFLRFLNEDAMDLCAMVNIITNRRNNASPIKKALADKMKDNFTKEECLITILKTAQEVLSKEEERAFLSGVMKLVK